MFTHIQIHIKTYLTIGEGMNYEIVETLKWKRSVNGWFLGVCEGLGDSFDLNPNLLRALLLLSILAFGTGIFLYLILGFTLPREDEISEYKEERFLGVCKRISISSDIEIGLVRVITVFSFFASAGTTLLLYIILNFALPKKNRINY